MTKKTILEHTLLHFNSNQKYIWSQYFDVTFINEQQDEKKGPHHSMKHFIYCDVVLSSRPAVHFEELPRHYSFSCWIFYQCTRRRGLTMIYAKNTIIIELNNNLIFKIFFISVFLKVVMLIPNLKSDFCRRP